MGKLYDYCMQIQEHIEARGLDVFRTRGELALQAGFLVSLIEPEDPDDPVRVEALRDAAYNVLGLRLE